MAAPKGNKYALGNNGGRPRKYEDGEAHIMEAKILDYFDYCMENECEVTITGLTLFLGFASKDSLYDYAKRDEFSDCIKRALLVVENKYEEKLLSGSCTGAIFALKNMKWKDTNHNKNENANTNTNIEYDMSRFSNDDLDKLDEITSKALNKGGDK